MPGEEISDITPEQNKKPDVVESTKMYLSTNETNVFMVSYADFNNDVTQIPSSELLDFAVQGNIRRWEKITKSGKYYYRCISWHRNEAVG
nr:hypothetical protein [Nostoc sp. CmiVER01]